MRVLHRLVVAAMVLTGCAAPQEPALTRLSWQPVSIETTPVALDPSDPSRTTVGSFEYAGGLELRLHDSDVVHELSGLASGGPGRLLAVSDYGALLDVAVVLDEAGRLVGLGDARLATLTGVDGRPLLAGTDADAEGLAVLADGSWLVGFERRHRILRYPAAGGPPERAPAPAGPFPPNAGLEALAADPERGPDAYIVGSEASGETWTCRLSEPACRVGPVVDKPERFGLVSIQRLPGMTVWLLRAYDPVRRSRVRLEVARDGIVIGRMDLAPPLTIDNFEGLAALGREDGSVRFYLVSDDNANRSQRTLLVAFDWRPPAVP